MAQKLIPYVDELKRRHDYFYEDVDTGIIYFRKGHSGKRLKFSTAIHKSEFLKAKRFANKRFDELTGKSKKVSSRTLIKDELKTWLAVKESEGLAEDTMNNIRRAEKQIKEFWGSKFPFEINRDNITKWYDWWKEHHSDIQMENAIKYLRNFCRYLAEKTVDGKPLLPAVPKVTDPNYKNIRRNRKRKKLKIFDDEDFQKIMNSAEGDDHRLVVLIMYTMGTRITETLEMRFDQEIHLDAEIPRYQWSDGQNKADHDGWHALHDSLLKPLNLLRKRRIDEGTDRLFPQQNDNRKALREQQIDWAEWRKRAKIGWHWTPHTFRHTCLSNLFNDEKNPQALVCKLYRVSLATAMETYIKPTKSGIEKMRNAIKVNL